MHHPGVDKDDGWPDEDFAIGENFDGGIETKKAFLDWCDSANVYLVLSGHSHQSHIYDRNLNSITVNSATYPQYIQTQALGSSMNIPFRDDAYRIIEIKDGKSYPQEHSKITWWSQIVVSLHSPANLHIYDSLGGHVGTIGEGEAERGIPNSFYFSHYVASSDGGDETFPEKIIMFEPEDDYLYEVVGADKGTYRLVISSGEDGEEVVFEANDIPTTENAVHQFVIDWDVLSEGGEGVIVAIDDDGDGDFERTITADNELTLAEFDTEPPTINSVSANPNVLWPVNHKMVEVTVDVDAEDDYDPAPVCRIVNVASNEPINDSGDGNTAPDWDITGDLTVDLRAERGGSADGRVYTIHVECKDAAGNIATATVNVTVPHDKRQSKQRKN